MCKFPALKTMNSGGHSHNACPKVKLWTLEFIVAVMALMGLALCSYFEILTCTATMNSRIHSLTFGLAAAMNSGVHSCNACPNFKTSTRSTTKVEVETLSVVRFVSLPGTSWPTGRLQSLRKSPNTCRGNTCRGNMCRGNTCRGNTCRGNICLGNNRRLWLRKGCRIILIPWAPLDLVLQWNLYCLVTFLTQICVVCSMTRRWLTWVVGHCKL